MPQSLTWDQTTRLAFIAAATSLTLWLLYFRRGSRQQFLIGIDKDQGSGGAIIGEETSSSTDGQEEGNASSTSSWLLKDTKKWGTKFDLLHTGNIKGGKLVVVMVGLPNRGKTYISRKVARYLRWISYRARVFSLAKYRLDKLGNKPASFFDPKDAVTSQQRDEIMMAAVEDLLRYLSGGGEIAILDGTNCTRARRQRIKQRLKLEDGYEILWIESIRDPKDAEDLSITDAPDVLKDSPDYMDKEDFLQKLAHYESIYEPLAEDEGCYVKVYGSGHNLRLHEIHGYLPTKIASFVMNLHTVPRPVYMTRHGESVFNVKGLIGGDSGLSHRGSQFAQALSTYIAVNEASTMAADKLCVWTSTMRRCRETAAEIKCKRLVEWRALREIEVGVCDGLSYEQVKIQFPEEFRARDLDKLRYRYPRGESYMDVINRLEPVIFELERQTDPLIIIGHQAVLRCLYAYFFDLPAEEIPYLSIPLHTLIRLEPRAIGCTEKRMRIVVEDDRLYSSGVGGVGGLDSAGASAHGGSNSLDNSLHGGAARVQLGSY